MKIALFADSWMPTLDGVAVSAMSDYLRLQRDGHDVTVCVPNLPRLEKGADASVKPWWSVAVPHYEDYAIAFFPPTSYLRELAKFDLVYYHGSTPSFAYSCLGQARLLKQRFVWRFTTFVPDYVRHAASFMKEHVKPYVGERCADAIGRGTEKVIGKAWHNFLAHVPYAVVANQACADYVAERSKAEIKVIPPRPMPAGPVNGDPMKDIPRGKRIAVLARHSVEKNLDAAIDTFVAHVQPRHPDAQLVMMGDGPSREGLERRAAGNPGVRFVGMVPNDKVHAYLSYSDLFLYTSLSETHGLVVEEAKRAALPVVAFDDDRGVAAQVRGSDGGYLAPAGRNDVLGARVNELLADEAARRAMGRRAQADQELRATPVPTFFPDFRL